MFDVGAKAPAAVLLATMMSVSTARSQGAVEWEPSYDQALQRALSDSQPVLLDFSAQWCAPCRDMDEKVWTDPDLVSLLGKRVVPVRIDFDAEKKLARRYKVAAIPTMIWADPWGDELGRNLGFTDAATLRSVIESLPQDFGPLESWHELVSRKEEQAVPLVRIASFYRERGFLIAADSFYERAVEASKKGKREPQAAEQAYVGLGLNMLAREQAEEARKLFEKALKLPTGPNRANALYGLVAAHAKLGDQKKAALRLEELRLTYPNDEKLAAAEALVAGLKRP